MPVTRIVHLTPIRDPFEPRTFFEAQGAAAAGFAVTVVAPHAADEQRDGVTVLAVPRARNRLERITWTSFRCLRRGLAAKADIYHLHDPEFVLWGLLLRLLGKPVIYDVHEDYVTAAAVRPWLPGWARPLLAGAVHLLNALARRAFVIVIAERYYVRSFPEAVQVLNYAKLEEYAGLATIQREPAGQGPIRLLYAGAITESRGARQHLRLLEQLPEDARLRLIGFCDTDALEAELRAVAARDQRLELVSSRQWLPRERIVAAYAEPWTAGLALFPDTPHYREKELTKFFEYMAAGLPLVCSDFPVWRELVEGHALGWCVDPEDPVAAVATIHRLAAQPDEARAMGERGRRLVEERFNWGSQMRILNDLYRRLLAA